MACPVRFLVVFVLVTTVGLSGGCDVESKPQPASDDTGVSLGKEIVWDVVGTNTDGSRLVEWQYELQIPITEFRSGASPDGEVTQNDATLFRTETRSTQTTVPAGEDIEKFLWKIRQQILASAQTEASNSFPIDSATAAEAQQNERVLGRLLARANFLIFVGRDKQALELCDKALTIDSKNSYAHYYRGRAFGNLGDAENMARSLELSHASSPSALMFANSYAWFLATCPEERFRNGDLAVRILEPLRPVFENDSNALGTMAACYAEKGNFNAAVEVIEKAVRLPSSEELNSLLEEHLELFRKGKAVREPMDYRWPSQIEAMKLMDKIEALRDGKLGFSNASADAQRWWEDFEIQNSGQLGLVLKVCNEIEHREATLEDFFQAYLLSGGSNIQGVLDRLDSSTANN